MKFRYATFPPNSPWDSRLRGVACGELSPVELQHSNPWFDVLRRGEYFTVESRTPQVIVLPVMDDRAFIMVRVKRPLLNDAPLELPAGGAEPGESPEESAARELAEETGITITDLSRFTPMPPLSTSPNRIPQLVYVFHIAISQNEFEIRRPHDNEIENVNLVTFHDAERLMATGGIYVAAIVAIASTYLLVRNQASKQSRNQEI